MISINSDAAITSNDISIDKLTKSQQTPVTVPLKTHAQSTLTANDIVKLDSSAAPPLERRPTGNTKELESSSPLMDAFISVISDILARSEGDSLLAKESAEIIIKCKSYLPSLLGNEVARRYIATTMLITRNNYSTLDARKRAKIIGYLDSYHSGSGNSETLQTELIKLYKSGLKPL